MELTASTIKRPPAKLLARFSPEDAGNDRVGDFLRLGWSMAICCRSCTRAVVEWTPAELQRRYSDRLNTRIADIAARLSCTGVGGCGSGDVVAWPHPYDGAWSWPPSEDRRQ